MSVLIRHGLVLTLDKDSNVYDDFDLLIEDGLITRMGHDLRTIAGTSVDKVIDASRRLVMPGLVNAHLHSYDVYMKGLYEDLPLEIWLPYVSLASRRPLTEREIYIGTLRVATEMIRNGITAAHDNARVVPLSQDSVDSIMAAYRDSGMRAIVSVYLENKPFSQYYPYLNEVFPAQIREKLDSRPRPGVWELVDFCRWMIRQWDGEDGRMHVGLAPAWPPGCTDDFMTAMDELSRESNAPLNTHVQESKVEVVTGREFYGETIVGHLAGLGVLTPRLAIHHGVWLTDHDLDLLAEGGASVVHNPSSNLKLKSGLAPILEMLQRGINVALGCDNNTANDAQNVFDAMKLAALLPEVAGPEFGAWEPAREAVKMATAGGARSVLLQDQIGSLEVGKRADIILLDLNSHSFTPLNDPVRQLVYSENGRSVDTVLVNGRVVMENKNILTVDEAAILDEAHDIGLSLRDEHKKAHSVAEELRPYWEEMYRRCVRQDVGMNRYSRPSSA